MKENVEKRVINIIVDGSHITKDSRRAGVRGEGNATTMKFTFGGSWEGYAKSVIFLNAKGEKPTEVVLSDPIDDDKTNNNTAECKVPFEALEEEGECSFVVRGILTKTDEEGNVRITKEQRTETETLVVLPCEEIENPENAKEPTADVVEQLKQKVQEAIDAEKEHQEEVKKELEGVNQKQKEFDSELDEFGTELEGFGEKLAQEETVFDEKIKTHNRSEDAHGGLLKTLKDNVENLVNAKVAKDGTATFSVGYDVGLYYKHGGEKKYLVQSTADGETLESIRIVKAPDKMEYTYLEVFLPEGMVVEATYKNNESGEKMVRIVTGLQCVPAQFGSDWKAEHAPTLSAWENGFVNTTVAVLYEDNGITKTVNLEDVCVKQKVIQEVPKLEGETTFVYNKETQYPKKLDQYTDSYCNGLGFAKSGDNPQYAKNAGDYAVNYTPLPGYQWPDGQEMITLSWTIEKAPGVFHVDKTELEMVWWGDEGDTNNIAVENPNGFDYFVSISEKSIVTVDRIPGANTIKVTAVAAGTCFVTIEPIAPEESNYYAPGPVTCSVTVEMLSDTFSANSWATIAKAAQLRKVPDAWKVGDTKILAFSSIGNTEGTLYNYAVRIIGKEHDEYSGGGSAPLTLMTNEVTNDLSRVYISDGTPADASWLGSDLRNEFLPRIKGLLPEEVRDNIRKVEKFSYSTWMEFDELIVVGNYTEDELFILSETELNQYGEKSDYACGVEGKPYEYFENNPSLVKRRVNGGNACWWSRSASKRGNGRMCRISGSGEYCDEHNSKNFGVSFAFCF